jgi:hypothetical protein
MMLTRLFSRSFILVMPEKYRYKVVCAPDHSSELSMEDGTRQVRELFLQSVSTLF